MSLRIYAGKDAIAHGIEEDVVRDLPDLIKSPALVVVGDGRISVISDVTADTKNESNAPLLIGIDPQSSVDGQDAYEIKSIYGRERFSDWLELRAKESKILVENANKAAALLRNVGKSYPEPVAYATDLTSRILSQSETPVKRGESFSVGEVVQETGADPIEAMPVKAQRITGYQGEKRSFPTITGSSAKGGALCEKASVTATVPQPELSVKKQESFKQKETAARWTRSPREFTLSRLPTSVYQV